ncbi:hypothetical protein BD770DRAFT_360773 [Pilaira anomala]|nr:hypothetical protein BD770DRAFT_360773 [Pilaira anomala]
MDKTKESYTKKKIIWAVPYFTALSTIAILAYFITSLIYNSTLTGHAIQISPFNQMIGPAPETLIYLGARYVPCIKPSNSYPTAEKKYTCPSSKTVEKCTLDLLCGGPKFSDANIPNQTYRFFSALFMHSGIVQLILNMVSHIWIGHLVERRINSIRYSTIWVGSGVFGYIFGAIFVPEGNVSVGCSASLMGVMGFLVIDLILNWKHITRPRITACKFIACFVVSIIIGLLPGYDNFSHFGGFLAGLLITLIVMPFAKIENSSLNDEVDKEIIKYKQLVQFWIMRMIAISFIVILIWILLHLFLTNLEQLDCNFCQFLSCITFNDMCTSK